MAQVTPDLVQLAQSLTAGLTDERSKVNALYQWVSQNIRYVSVAIGNGGWVPHPAAQGLEHRYGDCKDHAVLMQALLLAVGIQAVTRDGDRSHLDRIRLLRAIGGEWDVP